MAAGDGVEQQLIQQLDALIDEGPDDELAAARGRRTLMDELLQKSPRVAPEGGGALLFNASPRIAPADGAAPLMSSPRVKPLWRSEASPRIAPDGGGALLFNASPRVAPVGMPEGAAPVRGEVLQPEQEAVPARVPVPELEREPAWAWAVRAWGEPRSSAS